MDPVFKCKYQASEQNSLDYLRWSCYHSASSIVMFVLAGIAAIAICSAYLIQILSYVRWGAPFRISPDLIADTVLFMVLLLYVFWLRYLIALRRTKQRLNELYHGSFPVIELSFFEDHMRRESKEEPINLYYSDIKRLYRWKNYLYLRTKSRLIYFIPADGLESCTPDELAAFLRQKGIR